MTTSTILPVEIDIREIPPRERHPLILSTFRGLGVFAAMEIVNDDDPGPLYFQMQTDQPGRFSWDYLEQGPRGLLPVGHEEQREDQCCGACGGA